MGPICCVFPHPGLRGKFTQPMKHLFYLVCLWISTQIRHRVPRAQRKRTWHPHGRPDCGDLPQHCLHRHLFELGQYPAMNTGRILPRFCIRTNLGIQFYVVWLIKKEVCMWRKWSFVVHVLGTKTSALTENNKCSTYWSNRIYSQKLVIVSMERKNAPKKIFCPLKNPQTWQSTFIKSSCLLEQGFPELTHRHSSSSLSLYSTFTLKVI